MTLNPDAIEGMPEAIATIYSDAEQQLIARIARSLQNGLGTPDWAAIQLLEINQLAQLARGDLLALNPAVQAQLEAYIAQAAYAGQAAAAVDLAAAAAVEGTATATAAGTAAQAAAATAGAMSATPIISTLAVQALAGEVVGHITGTHAPILRASEDAYRRIVSEVAGRTVTGTATTHQILQQSLNKFADEGITGFTDRAGRRWKIDSYAEMATRTATMRALQAGHTAKLMAAGRDLVVISSHANSAPQCAPYQGQIVSLSGNTSGTVEMTNRLTGQPMQVRVFASMREAESNGLHHPNCFPAGVMVTAPSGVAAGDKRWYEGELVVIRTASGNELSVTPNHPVLTTKGWVGAGALTVGGHVLSNRGDIERIFTDSPGDVQVPARIADVFDALRHTGGVTPVCVPASAEQFHGDGMGTEVEVVLADRLLTYRVDAEGMQGAGDGPLVGGGVRLRPLLPDCPALEVGEGASGPSDGVVCGSGDTSPILGGGEGVPLGVGLAAGDPGAKPVDPVVDARLCDAVLGGKSVLGRTGTVLVDHLDSPFGRGLAGCGKPLGIADAASGARGAQGLVDPRLADREGGRKLADALAGLVFSDEIVSVDRRDFAGHVYNLESGLGWYTANSVIVHNCGHRHTLYVPGAPRPKVEPYDPEKYRNEQKLRYHERQVRAAKRRQAAAITPEAEAKAKALLAARQARLRDHVATTGTPRRRYREQLRTGRPGTGDTPPTLTRRPPPEPPSPTGVPRNPKPPPGPVDDVADLDELAKRAEAAIEAEDFELLDAIDARENVLREKIAKREARNAAARDKRAAETAAKRAKADADYDRLVAEGVDPEDAIERAFGVSVDQQRRENAIHSLRSQGYSGDSFDEVTRNAYADTVHTEWLRAENELAFLVRKDLSADVDPRELWKVNESTARKWATPELLEYWDIHGRTTLDGFRANWLGGVQAGARGGDFYQ